jgi:hypothetical protein
MIVIVTSEISETDLENKVNEREIKSSDIVSATYSVTPIHDLYRGEGGVCNQWHVHSMVIILKD